MLHGLAKKDFEKLYMLRCRQSNLYCDVLFICKEKSLVATWVGTATSDLFSAKETVNLWNPKP